jgi:ABC-2 type transport system ATP-binding protein
MSDAVLEFKAVTKRYGGFTAVEGLSFDVPRGSSFGFLGPNGAGKTTSLRMALGIFRQTEGEIRLLGDTDVRKARKRVGYLPEEKGLYRSMKTWEAVAFLATLKGLSDKDARRRAFELLKWAGLDRFAKSKVGALSKGMAQKAQVMAAIAHEPELAILDEPFSGLDPVNQSVVESVIQDLRNRGKTVVFSTHVMAHAERMCDRIMILARGRKRFEGTPAEARRLLPNTVRLETLDTHASLPEFPKVAAVRTLSEREWECQLEAGADPHSILETCFLRQIRLKRFFVSEPSLHDVFVHLVGADAIEAGATAPERHA